MGKKKNHIDNLFNSRLRQFEASPPSSAWEGIAASLDSDRRKQKVLVFWRMAASVAVLIAVGTTIFLVRQTPEESLAEKEKSIEAVEQSPPRDIPLTTETDTPAKVETPVEIAVNATAEAPAIAQVEAPVEDRADPQTPVLARMEEGPYDVKGVIFDKVSLAPLHAYPADLFVQSDPEYRILTAHVYPGFSGSDSDPGTLVIDEWVEIPEDAYSRWSVGTQVTPLYSYRSLSGAGEAYASASYFDEVENGMLAYAGGVNVNYSPLRRLTIQSGLYYSKMGMVVGNVQYASVNEVIFGAYSRKNEQFAFSNSSGNINRNVDPVSGRSDMLADLNTGDVVYARSVLATVSIFDNIAGPPATEGEIIQHFEYLELPMILRYRVVDRKIGFNILGGMSTNFLVGRNVYFQQDGNREILGKTGNLKTVNYSSVIGVGLDYAVTSRLNLNFEPTFRYYINSINAYSSLGSHPYSFGFYTGLSYSF